MAYKWWHNYCSGLNIYLFSKAQVTSSEVFPPPIQRVLAGALSWWVKLPGSETDHYRHLVPRLKMS
jgi:hypothetical protein